LKEEVGHDIYISNVATFDST